MTDPRIIALSSNPGQVEPGPFSEDDLREQWNAQADEFNQWESLDSSEQLAWAQTRAIAAQPADQAEGPSLADVDELCEEFSFHYEDGDSLEILQEMITAAITRWRTHGSVAQSGVVAAIISEVDSKLGQPVNLATPAPGVPDVARSLRLAEIIRKVDGRHDLGAAALAEAILAHPGFSGCHDAPAALPAQEPGEVGELAEFTDSLAALPIFDRDCAARIRRTAELLKGLPHA